MPTTSRPFFANFFAAFRAHSALQKPTSPTSLAHNPSSSSSLTPSTICASTPRAITTTTQSAKPQHHHHHHHQPTATSAAVVAAASQHFQSSRHHLPSTPRSAPPQPSTTQTTTTHHTTSGSTSSFPRSRTSSLTRPMMSPQRRDSDTWSSEGGILTGGKEKWYIGGRTAQGDERFYKLGIVRRYRSCDRLSLDRLSL